MNAKEIIDSFSYVAKEKGIEKNELSTIIEDLFTTLIMKKYGEENIDKFTVICNMDKGVIEIFHERDVVDSKTANLHEISIDDALKLDSTLVVGDMFIDILEPDSFGRRLINTAKQFLLQKIKEQEKKHVYDEFESVISEFTIIYTV